MSSNLRKTMLGAFGLAVAATVAASRAPGDQGPGGPVAAIKQVLDKQEEDWNKGDLDAFLVGYWDSPKVVFQSGGDRNVGFEAMRDRYRKRYKAEGKSMGQVVFSETEIEPLGPDSAFVRGRWGLILPDGKKPGGLFTLVFRKLPEGWKIVHDHTSAKEDPLVPPAPPAPSPGRAARMIGRSLRRARLVVATGLILTIALGTAGQVVRDRSVAWALLMYLPLVPLGLAAAAFDGACRGRALPKGRFVLGGIGLVGAMGGAWPMVGFGPGPVPGVEGGPGISVLHWNVIWGGGKSRSPTRWAAIRREILGHPADLIVLSEAPPEHWLDQLVGDLGPGASRVQSENGPGDGYWFKMAVCSKGPLRLVRPEPVADGAGMVVEAEVRGRTVRLLVVDAQSRPTIPRTPRLLDIAAACRRAGESGGPVDVAVGDFNSVSRSLGFDAIEGEGYALASRSARGWRGTFPSSLPAYDIDHVFIRRENPILGCELFTDLASDHRGQVARFRRPD